MKYLNIEERNKHAVRLSSCYVLFLYIHICVARVSDTFLQQNLYRLNTQVVCVDDHGYDADGEIMEEIPAEGCSYVYMVGDSSFGRLPEDEQLVVIPVVMRTLRMACVSVMLDRWIQSTKRSLRCICGILGLGKGIE